MDDYAAKINYLINSGFEKDAYKKYEEMIENNIAPNLEIFTDLIGVFAKKGDVDQIKKLLLEMQINDVKPTTNIFNVQIEMHINKGTTLLTLLNDKIDNFGLKGMTILNNNRFLLNWNEFVLFQVVRH